MIEIKIKLYEATENANACIVRRLFVM